MRPWRLFISLTRVAFAGVFCFFSLGGCGKHGGSHETGKLTPCRLPGIGEELLCGKLTVFENRQSRTGRTIDLNVVVLPALDPNNRGEPLFDLAGGPGAASTEGASFYAGKGRSIGDIATWCWWINANLKTSPPQIRASVERLGFRWVDTKILLNSQAHFDYMAGAAQILRKTG